MDAKQRDLPFWQIYRKMVRILRYLVERKLTDQIRSGPVTDDTVGLQLHWSIIKEFIFVRQHLSDKGNPVIGLHGLDLYVNIHVAGPE